MAEKKDTKEVFEKVNKPEVEKVSKPEVEKRNVKMIRKSVTVLRTKSEVQAEIEKGWKVV